MIIEIEVSYLNYRYFDFVPELKFCDEHLTGNASLYEGISVSRSYAVGASMSTLYASYGQILQS